MQDQTRANGEGDHEMPKVTGNLEVKLPDDYQDDLKVLQLPVLAPGQGSGAGGDGPENGGGYARQGLQKSVMEIPDSDAISLPSSPENGVRANEGVGSGEMTVEAGGGNDGISEDWEAVGRVEDEGRVGAMGASGVEAVAFTYPSLGSAEVHLSGQLRQDAGSKEGDWKVGAPPPTEEAVGLQASPVYGSDILPRSRDASTHQTPLLQNYTNAEEALIAEEATAKERAQIPTSAQLRLCARCEEGDSEHCSTSTIEEATNLESTLVGDLDVLATGDFLPTGQIPCLQRALLADEALFSQEASTTKEVPSQKQAPTFEKVAPIEIPPSDDEEDATNEDTEPLASTFEFHTTHRFSSEDPDTFMNVQPATSERNVPVSAMSLTYDVEIAETIFPEAMEVELTNAPLPNTNAAGTTEVVISPAELLEPSVTAEPLSSETMNLEIIGAALTPVERGYSDLVGLPPSSVNLHDYGITSPGLPSETIVYKLSDAPLDEGASEPVEAPALSSNTGHLSTIATMFEASADPSKTESIDDHFSDDKLPGITASLNTFNKQLPGSSSLPTQTQSALASPFQQKQDNSQANLGLTSSPKPKEGSVVPTKPTITPSTSSTVPIASHNKEGGSDSASRTLGIPNSSSIALNRSRSKEERRGKPPKMTDAAKASHAAPDGLSNKDVLFDELKAMKIVCLVSTSIPPLTDLLSPVLLLTYYEGFHSSPQRIP